MSKFGFIKSIHGPKRYVAPNGKTEVDIFPHGYIEFVGELNDYSKELLHEMSIKARDMIGKDAKPTEVFELMGWTLK